MASRAGRRKPVDAIAPGDSRTRVGADSCEWARQTGTATLVHIHARPGAKKTAVVGLHGGRLKVAIAAPPVDGKANDALLDFMARALRRPRAQVQMHSGSTHRDKCVRIEAADASDVARQLQALFPAPPE